MGRRAGFSISKSDIVDAGVALVRESGLDALRIRAIARALDVGPSALYNHIRGNDELLTEVAVRGWEVLLAALIQTPGADLSTWAHAYRRFALDEPGLYGVMTQARLPWDHPGVVQVTARAAQGLADVGLSGVQAVHLIRGMRSLIHGFVQLELAGQFTHVVPAEESFEVLIQAIASAFGEGLPVTTEPLSVARISLDDPRYAQERTLRNEVLLRPIGLPDGAWEMRDGEAHHFVACEGPRVVGCLLCWPVEDEPGVGQLMQMAVREALQGRGIGRRLIEALVADATDLGLHTITCHARDSAVGFYARLGFEVFGEAFVEVGIGHRHMRREL